MCLLLDTHAFLWILTDDPRLGPVSRELITNAASGVFLSQLSRAPSFKLSSLVTVAM